MSTSPRLAPGLETGSGAQPFLYLEAAEAALAPEPVANLLAGAAPIEDGSRREAAAREAGRLEGEALARAGYEQRLQSIRESMSAALADFALQKNAYYLQVEAEVVGLALSIARKILHREAQIDPLLLAGLVRMALQQMSGTKVTVRVCPSQVDDCRGFLARHMEPDMLPEVEEDPELEPEQCRLHTPMGTTELGVETQFKEIERGLLDLLAQRPPVSQ